MSIGLRPYPAPGGLLPWAESNEGGAVQFLAELCDGTLEPWALPRSTPKSPPAERSADVHTVPHVVRRARRS